MKKQEKNEDFYQKGHKISLHTLARAPETLLPRDITKIRKENLLRRRQNAKDAEEEGEKPGLFPDPFARFAISTKNLTGSPPPYPGLL